jgi:hypothetical protein
LRFARFAAIRAARGILREALLRVEVLLRGRERELPIAVATRQGSISGYHVFSSLMSHGDTRCRFEAFQEWDCDDREEEIGRLPSADRRGAVKAKPQTETKLIVPYNAWDGKQSLCLFPILL